MKILRSVVQSLFLVVLLFSSVARGRPTAVERIVEATTIDRLQIVVSDVSSVRRAARACAIQRRESLVPTACYSLIVDSQQILELDRECLRSVSVADRLPPVDQAVSDVCRTAVESRAKDLAYAKESDALRYP